MSDEQKVDQTEEVQAQAEAQAENVTEDQAEGEPQPSEVTEADALAESLEKIAKLEDQILRERAETQNVRKRVQKDVENARKFALEKFVGELLPVIDNLERAIDASAEADPAIKEGIELTLKSFVDVLAKFNVVAVDPHGEPFDANFHQAMTMVPNPDVEPNTVIDVMQKGYTLNERLVRPAMVVVSKAP
ncbi:MAG: nucleotide exchange factor GrpE [Cellvibrionales bacterium]|nr:nucleotide exchange factor GrpE [Cellvibrionales bacterium]